MRAAQVKPRRDAYGLVGNVRAELGRARVSATRLSDEYGGAVSYWTRRINGEQPLSADDVERIAEACRVHPAQLWGGLAPEHWTPPIGQYDGSSSTLDRMPPLRHLHLAA